MKTIFFAVFFIHALAVILLMNMMLQAPVKIASQKLLVKTVTLASERVVTLPQDEPVVAVSQEPIAPESIEKAVEIPEPEIVEEKTASKAMPETPPEKKEPQKKPVPKPAAKQVPKNASKSAPKQASKPVSKVAPKPVPKPAHKPAPKSAPKPVSTPAKKQAQQPKKEAEVKKTDVKPEANAAEIAKKQALINEALTLLNSSQKKATSVSSQVQKIDNVKALDSLQSELVAIAEESDDLSTVGERSYFDELVTRLQLALRLPEYGSVKVKLTLTSQGKFVKLTIGETKSQKNREYIEKMLKTVSFPPFGDNFPGQKEHTFMLNLSNALR